MDSNQTNRINLNRRFHPAEASRQTVSQPVRRPGLNADEQQERPFISQSKGDSTSCKLWLYMFVYTDKRNKAEPKGETLRTFKTCYEYNKDVKKKKKRTTKNNKNKNPRELIRPLYSPKSH